MKVLLVMGEACRAWRGEAIGICVMRTRREARVNTSCK